MSNLLEFPFKKTYKISLKNPVRDFISLHGGGHPDEFTNDIRTWQDLRETATSDTVHVERVHTMLLYHAQLTSILAKLPSDIQLEISYAPVFHPRNIPVSLRSLAFELAAMLFNLASLYSQLGVRENRSSVEGVTRAASYYKVSNPNAFHGPSRHYEACGRDTVTSDVLPKPTYAPNDEERPLDLSPAFVNSLESLMLAQA